jgi:UDP-3-O-[3-hydroxymyristoyl] N-acetylglucosamine deacetylase
MARDLEELGARRLAARVDPESVVVVAPDAIHAAGAPFFGDEPARHKLLDLIGDLYLYGGPPRGGLRAARPGHGATHAAIERALELGVLVAARKL